MIELKSKNINGKIHIPSSKSQTIRALIIATFAKGISKLHNPLLSADTIACIEACKTLGAIISFNEDMSILTLDSSNLDVKNKAIIIDTANSGTTTYLLYGLLASLGAKEIVLTGDKQLNSRPILPLVEAYKKLGVKAELEGLNPPVKILSSLEGGDVDIACPTSQYLSSLLLSLPLAKKDSKVDCTLLYEKPYVRLTLDWLDEQKIKYDISDNLEHVKIYKNQKYKPFTTHLTGDFSSACFFFVAAAITNSEITISGLNKNDSQGDKELLSILEKMGCSVSWDGYSVKIKGAKELKGGTFDLNSMPDCLPILSIAALKAKEPVIITNVAQARIKETDRIKCMCENLKILGAKVEEKEDGLIIYGKDTYTGGLVKGYKDHRIIMSLAIASLICTDKIIIDDEKAVDVTFPTFFSLLSSLEVK